MEGLNENPKLSRLITKFYARALQVIVESRLPTSIPACGDGSASSSAQTSQAHAFNLVLGKSGSLTDKIEPWCNSVWEPMVIDILYLQHGGKVAVGQKLVRNAGKFISPGSLKVALEPPGLERAILLERWTIEFVRHNDRSSSKTERETSFQLQKGLIGRYLRGTQNNKYRVSPLGISQRVGALGKDENEVSVEKNFSILVRSLYSTARLLPAHNLSRLLSTKGKCKSNIAYRVFTAPPPLHVSDKKDMTLFRFPLLDCHCGHLRMSVAYRRTVPTIEQKMPSLPPQIIMDYVGKAANHQLKQSPRERMGHVHSLPSALKTSNLQPHERTSIERALKGGQSWALVQPHDFYLIQNERFDCPFAINDQVQDRTEAAKLISIKSDIGGEGRKPEDDASLGSLLTMLRQPEPLKLAREFSRESKKTATDALNELKMYIDFKDNLLSVHSKAKG